MQTAITHVALWVRHLEQSKTWYCKWLGAIAGPLYENPTKGFSSYFLSLPGGGSRLELMSRHDIQAKQGTNETEVLGWAHIALSLGSAEAVDQLTKLMVEGGNSCVDGPRTTGDGYYESVLLDPEGNRVELTI